MLPSEVPDHSGGVLLIEDDDSHAQAIQEALGRVPGLRAAQRAPSLEALRAALAEPRAEAPALVIVDLHLEDGSALGALPLLAELWPKARLLVVSSLADERSVVEAIRRGAHGYIVKSAPREQLATAIQEVLAGNSPLTPSIARHLLAQLTAKVAVPSTRKPQLTPREMELLAALSEGLSYAEVAAQFGVTLSTVQSHIRNLYQKLRATSKVEAINHARRHGLLD